jgi:hypothetical protein
MEERIERIEGEVMKERNNFSLELQKSADDDNFIEELAEYLNIMGNNDVNEE